MALLLNIVILVIVLALAVWVVDQIGPSEPFRRIAKVVIAVIGVIYLIGMLTGMTPLYLPPT